MNNQDQFNLFWAAYPKKKAKGTARKWFLKHKPSMTLLSKMIGAIEIQKRSKDWTRDGGQYIPHPSSWLNAEMWDDVEEIELGTPKRNDSSCCVCRETGVATYDHKWYCRIHLAKAKLKLCDVCGMDARFAYGIKLYCGKHLKEVKG